MNRKEFLKTLGFGAATLASSNLFSACHAGHNAVIEPSTSSIVVDGAFDVPLPIQKYANSSTSLEAQAVSVNVLKNVKTDALGYQNSLLGPTFEVQKGEKVNIKFKNSHFDFTNIHWHGLKVPANQDGYPMDLITPNQSRTYDFAVNQRATMAWYHPHPHESTSDQTYKGLAGLFIVRDAEEKALNLPSGSFELPLVIQDKRITDAGKMEYLAVMNDVMTGYLGEKIVVNGVYSPFHEVSSRIYRLRILNASNARVYNLAFSNDMEFTVIGTDGGLLANAVSVKNLILGSGERVDILVDFSKFDLNNEVFLQSNAFVGSTAQGSQSYKIMKFRINKKETETFKIPTKLSDYQRISESTSIKTRTFDVSNPNHSATHTAGMHKINSKIFDTNRVDETVKANSTEIWVFDNSSGDEIHPMHLHGALFQILDRTVRPLQAHEQGWKDTVLLMPKEKARVIVQFGENKGKFVFHCHNLEHEDDGMMLNFEVV